MKRLAFLAVASVILFGTVTSNAFAGSWNIGADGGLAVPVVNVDNETFSAPNQLTSTDGFILGGHVLYNLTNWLALGPEMYYYQEGFGINGGPQGIGTNGSLAILPLSVRLSHTFGNWQPYLSGGVGLAINKTWFNGNYPSLSADTPDSFVAKLGVGTDYFFTKTTALNVELGALLNNSTMVVNQNTSLFRGASIFYTMIGVDFNL